LIIDLARSGQNLPGGFMAPLTWQVLSGYYKSLLKMNEAPSTSPRSQGKLASNL